MASGYFRSWSISLGVLSGLFLALVNLWLIQRSVGGLLAGGRRSIGPLYVIKITMMLATILFVLIAVLGLDAIGVVTGFSVLFIAIATGGIKALQIADVDAQGDIEVEVIMADAQHIIPGEHGHTWMSLPFNGLEKQLAEAAGDSFLFGQKVTDVHHVSVGIVVFFILVFAAMRFSGALKKDASGVIPESRFNLRSVFGVHSRLRTRHHDRYHGREGCPVFSAVHRHICLLHLDFKSHRPRTGLFAAHRFIQHHSTLCNVGFLCDPYIWTQRERDGAH